MRRSSIAADLQRFVEPGVKGRFLFNVPVANRLAGLLDAILRLPNPDIRRLFRVLLGTAAMEVCNAVVSGKGRRYRRNWEQLNQTPQDLDAAFVQAVEGAIYDAVRYAARRCLDYTLIRGDARNSVVELPDADVAIFSPPYPNSFDYTDVYNIELWALGYLKSSDENSRLRNATLRSHVQIKRDFSAGQLVPSVDAAISNLREAGNLWNRSIPDMIGAYFADLENVLSSLRLKLPKNGRVYMVVSDSRYSGVDIPVAQGLGEIACQLGFKVEGVEPFRSMRVSPQQGGRAELAESLLTFSVT